MVTATNGGAPTGSVDFVDTTTGQDLGSAPLSGGKATLSATGLAAGPHSIVARYTSSNATAFQTSNSSGLSETVGQATPTVAVTDGGGFTGVGSSWRRQRSRASAARWRPAWKACRRW